MAIKICPRCGGRYVVSFDTTDYIHECNSGNPALDQEDVVIVGNYINETQADIPVENYNNATEWGKTDFADNPVVNTTYTNYGDGGLSIIKTSIAGSKATVFKTISPEVNMIGEQIRVELYIKDISKLSNIALIWRGVWGGTFATWTTNWDITTKSNGWQNFTSVMPKVHQFIESARRIYQLRMEITTTAANITLEDGDVVFDYQCLVAREDRETKVPAQQVLRQGMINELEGTRAQIEDDKDKENLTRRGVRASTRRQRQHLEFINIKPEGLN